MWHRRAIVVTTFLSSLFGSWVWVVGPPLDNVPAFLLWNLVFIVWAIVIRWWLVAGGMTGLLASALTPTLHSDNLGWMVCGILGGVAVGWAIDLHSRPDPALAPTEPQSPVATPASPRDRETR